MANKIQESPLFRMPFYKLRIIWKVLTSDDWLMVTTNPPERPITMRVGDIDIVYRQLRNKEESE